jgi:putative spermidine/putrescine transport system ATP-binding protein
MRDSEQGSMTDTIVSFVGINKTYDGHTLVVNDLNLDVHRGEFLTILGSSGSGKTSSLMMVAGFEQPTSGDILLNGKSITRVPPHKRNIGVVFQNYALFPHMTVEKNLAFPLEARKVPREEIKTRIRRVLDIVRLGGYAERRTNQLSGGQQQRIALARALIFDPTLVLMDEPLGALDRQLREVMQHEIKQIHGTLGLSVIYVTHDQAEALAMSTRIAVLNRGSIEQISIPADLYERPQTSFVATFVGDNNCFRGKVSLCRQSRCVVDSGWGPVHALPVNDMAVGDDVMLAIRPERAALNPAPGTADNVFDAIVREVTYHGDHVRIRLALGDQDTFIVKIPNNVHDGGAVTAGQAIRIGWNAGDCRALDLESEVTH